MQQQESPREALARMDAERAASEAREAALRERHRREAGGDRGALGARLAAVDAELAPLRERYLALQAEIHRLGEERAAVADVLAEAELAARGPTDWPWLLDASNDGAVAHRAWTDAVEALGLHPSGYSPETNQRCVSVMLTRGRPESLRRTLDGLREILPHMRALPDGWIHVGVLESSLSRFGSWELRLRPGLAGIEVGKTRIGNAATFRDLESALGHVQDRHWFELAPGTRPHPGDEEE